MYEKAFSCGCIVLMLMGLATGCASRHEATIVPHVTQANRPRLDASGPESPEVSLDEVAHRFQNRLEVLGAENAADPLELDAYGGWVNAPESLRVVEPNGFFQVAKLDGAWWFITPEGNPFISKGATDVSWLGATLAVDAFHEIIVEKYGTEEAWAAASEQRALDWGFNTIGPWSSYSMGDRMSHAIIILDFGGANGPRNPNTVVTDYYDPAFLEHVALMIEQRIPPQLENPHVIGYFLDNEVVWGAPHFLTDKSMLRLYAEFPQGAPGRAEALRFAREAAGSVEAFNAAWNTDITDWRQLETLSGDAFEPETETARAATEAFMLQVFQRYAEIAIDAVRAVDPNRLILGCRFHNYPGDVLFEAAAEHFDVISMAFYEARPPVNEIDAIYERVDAPALIGEWTFKSDDSDIRNPLFGIYAPVVRTMEERSLAYDAYIEAFMRRPYGIGYHWYKWMDNPVLPDQPMTGDNCGLLNQNDEPYEPFITFISEVNRRVERWHAEGVAD